MKKAITLGVIGHVDHGKTALVRALTGIETDRLREEQERGLSIVLGFSWLSTTAGTVDLIDVPGHENFIGAMIAGATGLDGVLLCVAANEGISRQTIEHFDIATLLGLSRGMIVITKADLVDAGAIESLCATLSEFTSGTFLESAPIFACSTATGAGLDELSRGLAELVEAAEPRPVADGFMLPLDRVFTLRGFGVIGTGTLRHGPLDTEARVEIMPGSRAATVRGLQIHGQPVATAFPGQRIAVNLRGIDRDELERGDVLASPGLVCATSRIDAELTLLPNAAPIRNGAAVRILTGTTGVTARARLLDSQVLEGGDTAFVQWRLERPIATLAGERFLVRSITPRTTLGGGRFLDVDAERHRRFDESVQMRLRSAASGEVEQVAAQRLQAAGLAGVPLAELARESAFDRDTLREALTAHGGVEVEAGHFVDRGLLAVLEARVLAAIGEFHATEPRRLGIGVAALAAGAGLGQPTESFRYVLESLTHAGRIRISGDLVSLPDFDAFATLSDREQQVLGKLESAFLDGGLAPPKWRPLVGDDPFLNAMLKLLLQSRRLVRLRTYDRSDEILVHASMLDAAVEKLTDAFPYPSAFTVSEVRDLLGSTRRHVVPILEHLDATGATERTGDLRRLRS